MHSTPANAPSMSLLRHCAPRTTFFLRAMRVYSSSLGPRLPSRAPAAAGAPVAAGAAGRAAAFSGPVRHHAVAAPALQQQLQHSRTLSSTACSAAAKAAEAPPAAAPSSGSYDASQIQVGARGVPNAKCVPSATTDGSTGSGALPAGPGTLFPPLHTPTSTASHGGLGASQ